MHTYTLRTLLCILTLSAVPAIVHAETVLRVGESVAVVADQKVEDDFYAAGGIVTMSGEIVGDMYTMGGSVTINGTIGTDFTAAGGTVQVHGPVADDVRILGGDVKIAESVGGDVFVMAGSLTILSSASIGGDVYFYGGEAEINGAVGGSIMGTADRVRVDAPVAGDIDVTASRGLVLGDRAAVAGNVQYASMNELVRSQNAVIEGEVLKREHAVDDPTGLGFGAAVMAFVVHAFAVLCIYLAFRTELEGFARAAIGRMSRNGLIGVASVVAAPVTVLLLMITVLGFLLGLAGLGLLLAGLVLAYVLTAAVVGMGLAQLIVKQKELSVAWLLAGTLTVHTAFLIPVVGPLLVFAALAVSLGTMIVRLYYAVRGS